MEHLGIGQDVNDSVLCTISSGFENDLYVLDTSPLFKGVIGAQNYLFLT
jgi:hypothetical protein